MKTENKPKKHIVGKVLLAIAGVLLLLLIIDICITEIYAAKIPHRFASAKEGRELVLSNNDYFSQLSQLDIELRLGRSGATRDELIETAGASIKDFNIFEKYIIDKSIAKMARTLSKNDYDLPLPEEIVFAKCDMSAEIGSPSGYTQGYCIYLNPFNIGASLIPGSGQFFDQLIWHELFHCLTRNNPDFKAQMYSVIDFKVADSDFELPPCVRDRYLGNPDVEHHNSYATFDIDGQKIDCFLVEIADIDPSEVQPGVIPDSIVALVPIDGTDIYYTSEQASNFDEVLGTNTGYVTDPEECLADNFKYAMYFGMKGINGQEYPNPEIVQAIIDNVSR